MMNATQKQFYDYVLPMAAEGKTDELKAVLAENFRRQDDGTLDKAYMEEAGPKLIALLQPQYQDQFTQTMKSFLSNIS